MYVYNHTCIVDTDIVQSGDNWRERGYAGVVYSATELCIRDSKALPLASLGPPWHPLANVGR